MKSVKHILFWIYIDIFVKIAKNKPCNYTFQWKVYLRFQKNNRFNQNAPETIAPKFIQTRFPVYIFIKAPSRVLLPMNQYIRPRPRHVIKKEKWGYTQALCPPWKENETRRRRRTEREYNKPVTSYYGYRCLFSRWREESARERESRSRHRCIYAWRTDRAIIFSFRARPGERRESEGVLRREDISDTGARSLSRKRESEAHAFHWSRSLVLVFVVREWWKWLIMWPIKLYKKTANFNPFCIFLVACNFLKK